MKVTSATSTNSGYGAGGENLLAFETLELKACCAKRIINDWEDYILVQPDFGAAVTIDKPANEAD